MRDKIIELKGFESPFIQFSRDPRTSTIVGEETIRGVECYKMRVDLSEESELFWNEVWISKETLRDVTFARYRNGKDVGATFFCEYNGIIVAMLWEEWPNGELQQTVRSQSAEFNVGLLDSFFRIRD